MVWKFEKCMNDSIFRLKLSSAFDERSGFEMQSIDAADLAAANLSLFIFLTFDSPLSVFIV